MQVYHRGQQSPGRWTGFGQDKAGQRRAEQTTPPFCRRKKITTDKMTNHKNPPMTTPAFFSSCEKNEALMEQGGQKNQHLAGFGGRGCGGSRLSVR